MDRAGRKTEMQQTKEITSFLHGRLGNQLFVYAAVRAAQLRYWNGEGKIVLDNERYIPFNSLTNYKLCDSVRFQKVYLGKLREVFLWQCYGKHNKTPRYQYDFAVRHQRQYNKLGFYLCMDGYQPMPEKIADNFVMDGFFQSEKFFSDYRRQLLEELVPVAPPLEKNVPLIREIADSESVCVTVRLGDYIHNPVHEVCTVRYFQRAIDLMRTLHPDCVFYLFSDQPELARQLLRMPENTVMEQGNDPDYEKLRVMSGCRHFILSNSSFSWWAQWLSVRKDKTVIAPDHWYKVDVPCDIYQEGWILLPTEEDTADE